jgi:hypothetical protein
MWTHSEDLSLSVLKALLLVGYNIEVFVAIVLFSKVRALNDVLLSLLKFHWLFIGSKLV